MNTTERTVSIRPELQITIADEGAGRAVLVLHGGGGPATVASISGHLAKTMRVITPTHPGWNGTDRPESVANVRDLAVAYLELLKREDLRDVLVIGSSIGGWIACEMALRDEGRRVGRLVLVNSVGIEVESQPMRDFFSLDARGVATYAFHDGDRFYVDPATVPEAMAARQRANMVTLRTVAGEPMHDSTLAKRLTELRVPTLVVWGESDRIVTLEYGRAFTLAIPGARWAPIPEAGHLPQIERPEPTFEAIDAFIASSLASHADARL